MRHGQPTPVVPTRPRADGWRSERQCAFLDTLARHGGVADASREVGTSPQAASRSATKPAPARQAHVNDPPPYVAVRPEWVAYGPFFDENWPSFY